MLVLGMIIGSVLTSFLWVCSMVYLYLDEKYVEDEDVEDDID